MVVRKPETLACVNCLSIKEKNCVYYKNKVVVTRHGGPEVLQLCREELPEPAANEVLVRVLMAGVGYADIMAQRGGYPLAPRPPFTPGYDFAGVVEKAGNDVKDYREGDHVAGLNPYFGCYSSHVCVPRDFLVPFPENLDPAEVCSLVLNYLAAYCILHKKAKLQGGETVLVHSAAGGVGSALVQLATLEGAVVFGTASLQKHDLVRGLGAVPIDYQSRDFLEILLGIHPQGIDAAFDPFGGDVLRRSYRVVKRGGRVVSYGFAGSSFGGLLPMVLGVTQLAFMKLIPDGKKVYLCALPGEVKKHPHWYRQALSALIRLLESGKIKPVIGAIYSLDEAAKAHELLESGRAEGKILLRCS